MQTDFDSLLEQGLKKIQAGDNSGEDYLLKAARADPERWFNLGTNLSTTHPLQAVGIFNDLLKIAKQPSIRSGILNSLGRIFSQNGNLDTALDYFHKARNEFPQCPNSYCNIALVYKWKLDLPSAHAWIEKALTINPWHNQGQFTQSLITLLGGDFVKGFEQYECRWRDKANGLRKIVSDCPEWDGTNGKRIYIYGEQGSGDSILMLRYGRLLKERGLYVSWIGQKGLKPLIQTVPGIDEVVDLGDPLPNFDCHLPAVSLPRVFKTTIDTIPTEPCVPVPSVEKLPGFNVGICWRGSETQLNDSFRSTNLAMWKPVLDLPGINFHSLQVDNADEGLFYDLIQHDKPKDWMDSARLFAQMDLIVTVDTSVMHLAGSMGLPCFCAMHRRPYFVFPLTHPDSTPWYPSVKLFRCDKDKEWLPVFERIATELKTLC